MPDDYWCMLPRDFYSAMITYHNSKYTEYKDDWNKARWQVFVMLRSKSKKSFKPTDIVEFEWDKPEELEHSKDYLDKFAERIKQKLEAKKHGNISGT